MKEIKAIIQTFRLEAVISALHQIPGLPAVTISAAHDLAVERGVFDQVVKTKLELMVADDQVEVVVRAIQQAAPHRQSRRRAHLRHPHRGNRQDPYWRARFGALSHWPSPPTRATRRLASPTDSACSDAQTPALCNALTDQGSQFYFTLLHA
jgi:hypothetical protein